MPITQLFTYSLIYHAVYQEMFVLVSGLLLQLGTWILDSSACYCTLCFAALSMWCELAAVPSLR